MRKILSKVVSMVLIAFCATAMVACGGGAARDPQKSYITVFNYDGGVGTEWLYSAVNRFEALYANTSFESDKTGVKIEVLPSKSSTTNLVHQGYDVVCAESIYYNELIANNDLLDITDIVTSPLTNVLGCEETGTIEDKFYTEQKSALNALNGKYYVLPHYECYSGVSYDRGLFNRKNLFIKEGTGTTQFTNLNGKLSVGPDGERGTYDDGLPSSYEEFYNLMKQMIKLNIIPFIYSGLYKQYTNNLVSGLWVSYTGKDEFMLTIGFGEGVEDNTTEIITEFNSGNPVTERANITIETGYLTSQQAGKYYALKFLETIMKNHDNFSDKIDGTTTHLDAQTEFVFSDLENKPIAMIIEGSYWYNEATDALKASANAYPEEGVNRDFAFMPLPRQISGQVIEGHGTKNTIMDSLNSYMFIDSDVEKDPVKKEICKKFLQFCYTDSELQKFTEITGVFKGVNYSVDNDKVANLSNYVKHLIELREHSDIIHPYSDSKIFINAQSKFNYNALGRNWESKVGSTSYAYPVNAFAKGVTAEDYFKGLWIDQNTWNDSYSKYFS